MALNMSTSAQAQEIYGKAGFMGAGIDYAHGARTPLTPRGDVTTVGAITRDSSRSDFYIQRQDLERSSHVPHVYVGVMCTILAKPGGPR